MRNLPLFLALLLSVNLTLAQQTVSGMITDNEGYPLPGATIIEVGTNNGVVTDFDGNYSITVSNENASLSISFIGYQAETIAVNGQDVINIEMRSGNELEEIVVAGVAGATSRKKLSVSVASLSAEDIEAVPASSAAGALLGKVSGVSITNLGRPGGGSTIILRGAANLYGSQEPLVILDGVFVEGGLADINVDDIASFEIVKGASASSLYGSRAGNGVIVISSKRGKIGKTEVTYRSEAGFNLLTNFMGTNQSHGWELANNWQNFQGQYTKLAGIVYPTTFQSVYAAGGSQAVSGARIESPDNYSDNPYGVYNDHQALFFTEGLLTTNYISVSSGTERSRTLFSFENYTNQGVLTDTNGYQRQTFRFNQDYDITDNLRFSTSNVFINLNDEPGVGGGTFRTFSRLSPDANLLPDNPDGQPYWFTPDPHESEISNPLYEMYNTNFKTKQQRFLGSYNLRYVINSDFSFEVEYAFENNNYTDTEINKYESFQVNSEEVGFGYSKGSMSRFSSFDLSQKAQAILRYAREFGLLDVKAQLSYLAENRTQENVDASGNDFLYKDLPTLDNFNQSTVSISSNTQSIRAQNYFFIASFVYNDRYIFDGLYRQDGSSLFGENEKWNDYYRASFAYRLTEDIEIPGVQELKINAAIGTSGQRPGFNWQYEQVRLSGGNLSTDRLKGNPDLKPSLTTEKEFGINAAFLDRFTFEAAYSNQVTSDQFMLVSLFSPANAGKNRQWQNVGDLKANTLEFSLNAQIADEEEFNWNLGVNFSNTTGKILSLNAPKQQVGPDGLFLLQEDTEFGSMWGRVFVNDLDTMAQQLPEGAAISDYSINADGIVVKTADIGTPDEAGIIKVDETGTAVQEQIGNQNADFRIGLNSLINYKDFNLFMLWDWKQGGDVYNRNAQWNTISERNVIVDQAGKPENEKKTRKYYGSLYDVNQNNGYWVEDGTYIKLREIALSYNVPKEKLGNFFTQAKISAIGRNVLTFSDYLGWDPEVTSYSSGTQQYFAVDYGVYPTQSSYSLSLQVKF